MACPRLCVLLLGLRIVETAGYGFKYPRGSDQLYPGQLVNITWDTADEYVDLYWRGGGFLGSGVPTPDILIAKNITNSGWFEWQIPSDLPSDLSKLCSIRLMNSITEMVIINTEYLSLLPESDSGTSATGTWATFTLPTGAPEMSLRENTAVNISWDTQARFVNLSFLTDVNAPNPIFEMREDPGYYIWTVNDLTSYTLPLHFSLQSNETEYLDTTVQSHGFYVAPYNYPAGTTIDSSVGFDGGFLYPTTKDMTTIRFNDTMTFLWDPPVPDSWDLVMVLVAEKSVLRPNSLSSDSEYPVTYNQSTLTWRMTFLNHFPVDTPYHFNLLVNATLFDYKSSRLIYRSETFTMKRPTGLENTWVPPPDRLALATGTPATETTAHPSSSSTNSTGEAASGTMNKGLPLSTKLGLGLGIPFGIALIILAILVWLFRKRRAGGRVTRGLSSRTFHKSELQDTKIKAVEASPPQCLGVVESVALRNSGRRYEMA